MWISTLHGRLAYAPLGAVAALAAPAAVMLYLYRCHPLLSVGAFFWCGTLLAHFARRWRQSHLVPELQDPTSAAVQLQDPATVLPSGSQRLTLGAACLTCGKSDCHRHKHVADVQSRLPWTGVHVPERVDRAIESFFGNVLKRFVYSWYRDVSEDEAFVVEARKAIRFLVAVLIKRLFVVNVPRLLEKKIIPEIVKHAVITTQYRRRGAISPTAEELALNCFKEDMHYALTSRAHAAEYVRAVLEKVLPCLLSPEMLRCASLTSLVKEVLTEGVLLPVVDKVSESDTINRLLLVALDKEPPAKNTQALSPPNVILERFVSLCFDADAAADQMANFMEHNVQGILGYQLLLLEFMNFMKTQGATNYLQLYLSAVDFRKEFATMPCRHEDLLKLHNTLSDLYRCYMDANAPDRIEVEVQVVEAFEQASKGRPDELNMLCSLETVDRLCEISRRLLESMFLSDFLASSQNFNFWYGSREPQGRERGTSCRKPYVPLQKKRKGGGQSSLAGDRDGREQDLLASAAASTGSTANLQLELVAGEGEKTVDRSPSEVLHDLKEWQITIPSIAVLPDKELFQVQVYHRAGVPSVSVYRSLGDFYRLDQKLKEFHGSAMLDMQLPSRSLFKWPRREGSLQELDSFKPELERYLKALLRRPELGNSQLLHSFLADQDFLKRSVSDNHIENAIRSVPRKLAVERGQHLVTFLHRFLSSTKPKVSCQKILSEQATPTTTAAMTTTGSYVAKQIRSQMSTTQIAAGGDCTHFRPSESTAVESKHTILQYAIYVASEIFHISKAVHTALLIVKEVADGVIDRLLSLFIANKIQQISQEHRVEALILLLEEAVFSPDEESAASKELSRQRRQHQALTELRNFLPEILWLAVDKDFILTKVEEIFFAVQEPALNRQLAFVLFDIIMQELFEELQS